MTTYSDTMLRNSLRLVFAKNPQKREQLEKVQSICVSLTSDDACSVRWELFDNNITRIIVDGTRSQFRVCFNSITGELVRKPYKATPFHTAEKLNTHISDFMP